MDIATLLESHRRYMLDIASDYVSEGEKAKTIFAIEVAHDRATTRTLLDMYRAGQPTAAGTTANAASAKAPAAPSHKVKAGSKRAKDRALKAQETRRKNLAAKAGTLAAIEGAGKHAEREATATDGGAQ